MDSTIRQEPKDWFSAEIPKESAAEWAQHFSP